MIPSDTLKHFCLFFPLRNNRSDKFHEIYGYAVESIDSVVLFSRTASDSGKASLWILAFLQNNIQRFWMIQAPYFLFTHGYINLLCSKSTWMWFYVGEICRKTWITHLHLKEIQNCKDQSILSKLDCFCRNPCEVSLV